MAINKTFFDVEGTKERIFPKGHFLAQLAKGDMKRLKLKPYTDVIITHETGEEEIVNGKKEKIDIRVLAKLHTYYPLDKEMDGNKKKAKNSSVYLDQTIRAAIGVNKTEDKDFQNKVSIEKVPKTINSILSQFTFGLGKQRSIVRVSKATFTDMEINICRIKEATMESIGVANGDRIFIESATDKIKIRAIRLSDSVAKVRENQIAGKTKDGKIEVDQEKKNNSHDIDKNLRLKTIRETYNFDEDLPWIFIDFDARVKLKVKPGDPVTIHRNNRFAVFKNIQSLTIPLVAFFIALAKTVEYVLDSKNAEIATFSLYLGGASLVILLNLWSLRNK